MKRLLLLGMLLPLISFGGDDVEKEYTFEDFISEDGRIYRNQHPTGKRFSLAKRHWFETNKGGAGAIFIDIPAINVMNGYCFDGAAFKHHESGALIMKCFNQNGSNAMDKHLLFKTKEHHYFKPGYCDSRSYYTIYSDSAVSSVGCKPALYYSMGDVGDKIPLEECKAILDKARKYNFDFLCK